MTLTIKQLLDNKTKIVRFKNKHLQTVVRVARDSEISDIVLTYDLGHVGLVLYILCKLGAHKIELDIQEYSNSDFINFFKKLIGSKYVYREEYQGC